MASNNGNGGMKEERRRRIAERGSDRMALITGRINALPPTPNSPTSSPTYRQPPRAHSLSYNHSESDNLVDDDHQARHVRPHSLSPAFYSDYHEDNQIGSPTARGSAEEKHDASVQSSRLKHQTGFKYSNFEDFNNIGEGESLIQEDSEGDVGGAKTKPSSVTSRAQNESLDTKKKKKLVWHKHTFFSSRELNLSILASETTRAICSLIIALLVVFFYMISEGIAATRPIYIVLLTDITIVLGRLYREKARVLEETEGENVEAPRDGHSWGDAVKLMERGLVAYQAIRGIFIDCSIYIVVVVCAISFM
ncbi:PREDICTED: uncharacterized protein LOC109337481 [Lupinus angustifolius]|uniref:uncharacterized protein LOC109337481 n=1 Tax=Lupinus angustifolius TaxID=3871 RepID=UPI00092E2B35|nr:PREDICTED: uncharacterized protein LOC109337481 [Lupinus angustifolius]